MKSIVVLNALNINNFAFEKINKKGSSIERAIERSFNFETVENVVLLVNENSGFTFPEKLSIIKVNRFDSKSIFTAIYEKAKDYNTVFFADCDAPYLDPVFSKKLFELHNKYKAEYSFADGFPKGLAPELLNIGLVKILSKISNLDTVLGKRDFIFECLKPNINSYDIESIIATEDLQDLRLEFFANSKRNLKLCEAFSDINYENYAKLILAGEKKLFTLPAFYAIETSNIRSVDKIYFPAIENKQKEKFLSLEKFKLIVDKISEYSDDAVVSFSIIAEPFLNTEILKMLDYCLQQKSISILIETSAVDFDEETILAIKTLCDKYSESKRKKVFWIVYLDAVTKETYAKVSNLNLEIAEKYFNQAKQNLLSLNKYFCSNVFAQFVRMNENEEELESFYRYWTEKNINALIQKYDNFASQILDRRVADLSPIKRNVCWHLKRDMFILSDGTVLLCKEDIIKKNSFGNIFTDKIETIRDKIFEVYCDHVNKNYKGLCENCDEYYTYNF